MINPQDVIKRLKSDISKKILNLFLAEKEFAAAVAAKMEKLRQELEKEFGQITQQEKIQFLRQELNKYADEEFGAIFGVTTNAIRGYRSKGGIDRKVNGRLTKNQRKVVMEARREELGHLAKDFGCHEHYLLAIRKAGKEVHI